jgi:hypothetical protein
MLLGLFTTVSFAQHQRIAGGGTMPGAHLPNTVSNTGPVNSGTSLGKGSATSTRPSATTTPTAKTVSPNAGTVSPNTSTVSPNANTVKPDASTVPNHVTVPDASGLGNRTTAVGPN